MFLANKIQSGIRLQRYKKEFTYANTYSLRMCIYIIHTCKMHELQVILPA